MWKSIELDKKVYSKQSLLNATISLENTCPSKISEEENSYIFSYKSNDHDNEVNLECKILKIINVQQLNIELGDQFKTVRDSLYLRAFS